MGIKADEIRFLTGASVREIGRGLQDILASVRAGSVEELQSTSGGLAAFDDHADIEIVAQGASFTSMWAVQIYVWDQGEAREVSVVALGDGGFTRAMGGARNTTSLGNSRRKRDDIAAALGYNPYENGYETPPSNDAPLAAPPPMALVPPPPPAAPATHQERIRAYVVSAGYEGSVGSLYKGTFPVEGDRTQVLWVDIAEEITLISPIADNMGGDLPGWLTASDFGRYTVAAYPPYAAVKLSLPASITEDLLSQEAQIIVQYADAWENVITPGNDAL